MRLQHCWSPLLLLFSMVGSAAAAGIVSSANARLPASLSKVITSLNTEHECETVSAATLLFSRSMQSQQRGDLLHSLAGSSSTDSSDEAAATVVGTASGLVLAQPLSTTAEDVTTTARACGGTIVFSAHPVDLARGEGLFDDLAPAMEGILSSGNKGSALIVLVPSTTSVDSAKQALEKAADTVLSHLAIETPVAVLDDVFESVVYVSSPAEAAEAVAAATQVAVADATDRVQQASSTASAAASSSVTSARSAVDLAAARTLGPAATQYLQEAVQKVQQVCRNSDTGAPQLVVNFGELCDAAMERALEDWSSLVKDTPSILSSSIGNMLRSSLQKDLDTQLYELFGEQMQQLQMASFEDFRKGLSKLLVSPNLASDMDAQVKKSLAAFGAAAKKMQSKKCSSWSTAAAKEQYRRSLHEHVQKRLLAAKAGGQFKPLPRKGVTVGMHWLLPKPFGNDYRQEPWMVHATDSMVYVPKDKITDVSPEDVAAGDWRRKIVPSPVGNEMVYMQ